MDLTEKLQKKEQQQIDTSHYLEKLDKEFEILEPEELKYTAEQEAEFQERQKDNHSQILRALKKKDYITESNSFTITGSGTSYDVEKRLVAQKKVVETTIGQTKKAMDFFTKGSGGREYEAIQKALLALTAAREKNAADGTEIPDELYDNIKNAADVYVQTHNRVRLTMSGARRFKMAEVLSENIMNLAYLEEHTKDIDKEIEYAKEDQQSSHYVKDDAVLNKVTVLKDTRTNALDPIDPEVDAFRLYSANWSVLTLTGKEKLGYSKSYSAYQIMNCIKRGAFTKEQLLELLDKRVPMKGNSEKAKKFNNQKKLVLEVLDKMDIMDKFYENDQGLSETSQLYRGLGKRQVRQLLGLKDDKALKNNTKNLEYIRERLEGLVGKTFTDNAYISTSRDTDATDDFAFKDAKNSSITVVFDVVARKGTKAVGLEQISYYDDEKELLLKPGTKMFIRGFSISTRKYDGMKKPVIRIQAEAR